MNCDPTDQESFSEWLKKVRLRENPFRHLSPQKDPNIAEYFIPLGHLRLVDLVEDPQAWIIFGNRGHGKTSLRMMVAARCRPVNPVSEVLSIECNWRTLEELLKKAGSIAALTLDHWAEILLDSAISLLPEEQRPKGMSLLLSSRGGVVFLAYAHEDRSYVDELAEELEKAGIAVWYDQKLHKGRRWYRELEERIRSARAVVTVFSRQSLDSEWMAREAIFAMEHNVPVIPFLLEKVDLPLWAVDLHAARNAAELIRTLRATGHFHCSLGYEALNELASVAGVRLVVCLVDEIDEVPGLQDEPSVIQLLSCLMDPRLHSVKGIAFRYFLPASLEKILERQGFRLDRYRVGHLRWSQEDLKRLIRQRMIAFSESTATPYQSLGELCDPANGFAARIDDELTLLAEGNPRAVVCLADQLLRFHCREEHPPRFIQLPTWEDVQEWWLQEGRARILGPYTAASPFRIHRDRIFFQNREVVLARRYHALLRCLVRAEGAVCSPEDLARAGWPGDDPSGVTARAVDEAMRRMKQKLQKQGIDPRWIETVRGRGYRIRPSLEDAVRTSGGE